MSYSLIEVKDIEQLSDFKDKAIYQGFMISNINHHEPDMHLLVLNDNQPAARASIWWRNTPELEGKNVGTIGHFSAVDKSSAKYLLDSCCEVLKRQGVNTVIGPMNGSTWRSYRFITERGSEPGFFLEPDNPDEYPGYFVEAGFYPIEQYESAVCYDLSVKDERLAKAEERIKEEGIGIRKLDIEKFEDELNIIYQISLEGFKDNVLYTPMGKEDFIKQYLPLRDIIIPDLVLIAEDKDKTPIGFMFALPDINQLKRGQKIDTVILKTIAVLPERRSVGIGSLLLGRVVETASKMNYKKAVFALIHRANNSRNIAVHYGRTMRTYTLYAKKA